MYSVIIKKNENDYSPFGVNLVLSHYISSFGKDDILVAYPGYQSTKKDTIDCLCAELRKIAPSNSIYFAKGMNGQATEKTTGKTIHDCHIPTIDPLCFGNTDHTKCIAFVDKGALTANNIITKALLIGSSNISYNTYIKSPAPKGEMDVLLIAERVVGDLVAFKRFRNSIIETINASLSDSNLILFSKTIDDVMDDSAVFDDFSRELSEFPLSN